MVTQLRVVADDALSRAFDDFLIDLKSFAQRGLVFLVMGYVARNGQQSLRCAAGTVDRADDDIPPSWLA